MKITAAISALAIVCSILSTIGMFFGVEVARQIVWFSLATALIALAALASQAGITRAVLISLSSIEDLFLDDKSGKSARWISTRRIMTCYGAVSSFHTTADVTGNDPAVTARLDGEDLNVSLGPRRGTQTPTEISFPGSLQRFKRYELRIESAYVDTYTGTNERAFLTIIHPSLRLKMRVHFPTERPPIRARMLIEYGGVSRDAGSLPVENDATTGGTMLCWSGWFAAPGHKYRIEWQW